MRLYTGVWSADIVGQKVINRLRVNGDERTIDAGCGSGRLTGDLMERIPKGRLIAIDRSWNMLMTARANLRPAFGSRIMFAQVSLPDFPFAGWADLVFSTATFHWVKDHPALFAGIFRPLRSGGRLHAQCGGGPNLRRARELAKQVMQAPELPVFRRGPARGNTPRRRDRRSIEQGRFATSTPPRGADDARNRGGLSRVRDDGDLSPAPGSPARRGAQAVLHRSRYRAVVERTGALHARLLAVEHDRAKTLKITPVHQSGHQGITRLEHTSPRTKWARPSSNRAPAGGPQRVRARGARVARTSGQDKVYQVIEGRCVPFGGRELAMKAGDLLVAPEGIATVSATPAPIVAGPRDHRAAPHK
jgi:SAM-dependent methyltransferase